MTEGLSISIDNSHDQVHGGDELAYKISVRNTGSSDVDGLRITQSIPSGVRVVTAEQDGQATSTSVQWTKVVPAGKEITLANHVVFDAAPEGTARLASSVCAYRDGETRPVVCSTDSDQLAASAPTPAASSLPWWPLVVVVAVVAVVVVVWRLRRRKTVRRA